MIKLIGAILLHPTFLSLLPRGLPRLPFDDAYLESRLDTGSQADTFLGLVGRKSETSFDECRIQIDDGKTKWCFQFISFAVCDWFGGLRDLTLDHRPTFGVLPGGLWH